MHPPNYTSFLCDLSTNSAMALRLIRRAGRIPATLFFPFSSYHTKTLIQCPCPLQPLVKHNFSPLSLQSRMCMSEVLKCAPEDEILKLVSDDMQNEVDRSPLTQLVPNFNSFEVEEMTGQHWVTVRKKFGDNEEIIIGATLLPLEDDDDDDLELYISMVVNIFKDEESGRLEFACRAHPKGLEIVKVLIRNQPGMPEQPYIGPPFEDLDDQLKVSLYEFLEIRGINDELAEFLHKCMLQKDQNEYIRWMESVKSFIARKAEADISS